MHFARSHAAQLRALVEASEMPETAYNPVSQVLMNDDLLYIILKGSRGDLTRYARVCSAFLGPSVGVLWCELTSITPLWHLLAPPKQYSYHHNTVYKRIEKHLSSVSPLRRVELYRC